MSSPAAGESTDAPGAVGVVLVTYNSSKEVRPCLDAALAQAAPGLELDVVVVDNASSDGTVDALAEYGDRVRVVTQEENVGFAEGVNRGFATVRGEWVLLLNPDVVMDSGCLANLLSYLDENPRCAGAAASLRDPDGRLQRFARREVDLKAVAWTFTAVGRRLDLRRGAPAQRYRVYEAEWEHGLAAPISVDCPAAACVLVRREAVGPKPLDPAFPLFFNDADLWRRLRAVGWTLDVVPSATASHGYGTAVRSIDRARMRAEWVAATRRYLFPVLPRAGRAVLYGLFLVDAGAAAVLRALGRAEEQPHYEWRGTLGGLSIPGGAAPWLTRTRFSRRTPRCGPPLG